LLIWTEFFESGYIDDLEELIEGDECFGEYFVFLEALVEEKWTEIKEYFKVKVI